MAVLEVYKEPLRRRYLAPVCSLTTLFCIGVAMLALLTPLFLAYSASPAFWLKEATYREQPKVAFQYHLLLRAFGTAGARDLSMLYSTSSAVSSFFPDEARAGLIQSREVDMNSDGLADRVELNVQIPVALDEQIHHVQLLAFFECSLRQRARVVFESLAFVEASSGVPGAGLHIEGDLLLRQTHPLYARGGYSRPYDDEPLLDANAMVSAAEAHVGRILARYAGRNLTQVFQETYKLWQPTLRYPPANGGPLGDGARIFNTTWVVRVPVERVSYTPLVGEVLLDAWIKYLAVLVVVLFVLARLLSFVYYNQLVDTRVYVDQPSGVAVKQLHGL